MPGPPLGTFLTMSYRQRSWSLGKIDITHLVKGQIWDAKIALFRTLTFPWYQNGEVSSGGLLPCQLMGFWAGLAHPRFPSCCEKLILRKAQFHVSFFFHLWLAPHLLFLPELNPVFNLSDCLQNDSSKPIQILYPELQLCSFYISSVMFPI